MKCFKTSILITFLLCGASTDAALAAASGRLVFINSATGRIIGAGVDKNGYFQTSVDFTNPSQIGKDTVIPTASGVIFYSYANGGAQAYLMDGDASFKPGPTSYGFSPKWSYTIGAGDYTLYYDLNGNAGVAAVVEAFADGTLNQTYSSTALTYWTLLGKTDNFLLWYMSSTGQFVTGEIDDNGQLHQNTKAGTTNTGYTNMASVGDDVLLWNVSTGAWESGSISFTGLQSSMQYVRVAGATSNSLGLAGVDVATETNAHLFLYASATGAAVTGHFAGAPQLGVAPGTFVKDQNATLAKYYTSALRCGQYVTLYGYGTGQIEVGYVGFDGKFQPTQGFTLGAGLSVAAVGR